jgi:uncharacterized protein (TIGR04255 family)
MSDRTIFPHAPITEALIDIFVELPSETSLDLLNDVHDEIKEKYPKKEQRVIWKGEVKYKEGEIPEISSPSSGGPIGYLFKSLDGKQIAQARLDGFTVNRLKPYQKWEVLLKEAKDLWGIYSRIANPQGLKKLALRYINRIEIPLPFNDIKDYIKTAPDVAPELPQILQNFFMRLVLPKPKTQSMAIITQTMEPITASSKVLPFIFDIEVYKDNGSAIEFGNMWEELEELHEFKNEIFFGSITPKTRELFK